MGGDVHVTRHDTGGNEGGPVAVIQACLDDFEVSPDRIGCSGDSTRGPAV